MRKNLIIFLFTLLFWQALVFPGLLNSDPGPAVADSLRLDDQEATILAIQKVLPAVVSIVIYGADRVTQQVLPDGQIKTEKKKQLIGYGTGFLVTADGLIMTNKHVVDAAPAEEAQFRIILYSGQEYYAQLISRDPIYDLAILKIFDKNLPFVELGDSARLMVGSTVIAIGNALGRYQHSAAKGIVSGLGRSVLASDQAGQNEVLDNVIQTDANINLGNSGGPLINLAGQVVGINAALDEGGQGIGLAIPINDARGAINSVKQKGYIARPRLGLRYLMLTPQIARDHNLPVMSGAWITSEDPAAPAVIPDSPADKAGLRAGDIILEINGLKVAGGNSLLSVIQKYKPGDKIGLRVQRGEKIMVVLVILEEFR